MAFMCRRIVLYVPVYFVGSVFFLDIVDELTPLHSTRLESSSTSAVGCCVVIVAASCLALSRCFTYMSANSADIHVVRQCGKRVQRRSGSLPLSLCVRYYFSCFFIFFIYMWGTAVVIRQKKIK